ncbi:MAG: MBL fold metallo-hydrolase [Theionarchaea archaeon]|nr:MBL fold metallo-hydrolase [Theionarchaea archaeon]
MNTTTITVDSLPEIKCIQVPTPFRVGPVNIYIIGDILIDTGPLTATTLEKVMKEIACTSIRTILITHGHVDHHGLAPRIKNQMDCPVYVHPCDERVVAGYPDEITYKLGAYTAFLKKAGLSHDICSSFEKIYRSYQHYGESCEVEPLRESVETDAGTLRVIHTPGHTSGSVCFLLEHVLFSGDTLLPTISTNSSMHALFDERCGLTSYQNSLQILKNVPVSLVLPGHGSPIYHSKKRIEEILAEHAHRRDHILERLHRGLRSLTEIQDAIFGPVHPSETLLALSECYDHLSILEKEGLIVKINDDPPQFEPL